MTSSTHDTLSTDVLHLLARKFTTSCSQPLGPFNDTVSEKCFTAYHLWIIVQWTLEVCAGIKSLL